MRNLTRILALLVLATALGGCYGGPYLNLTWNGIRGSGRVVTETRDVSGFTSLTINGAARLLVHQAGVESLSLTSDDNVLPHVSTEVRGGRLYVEFTPGVRFANTSGLTVNLTVKELYDLETDGAIAADIKGLDVDHLKVNASGASWVQLAGKAEHLQVDVSGASFVQLSGKADEQDVRLSGAGAYDAERLETRRATVKSSGAGFAIVRTSDMLRAEISGAGYMEYIGRPTVSRSISGLGIVRQR